MGKELQSILKELVSNFAEYYDDEDKPYWWGHDTHLGDQQAAFDKAEQRIHKYKREHPIPRFMRKATRSSVFSSNRKQTIARAIFGKDIPSYWRGSTAEYDLLTQIAKVKGFKV